ncbi:MAG TPA: T9SS type A sorting domain-containing protein, partial [Flavobacteriales bacterium]|nr:T9SS type A sorting domain-containing protein [Flavobacteriales bacterium]
SGSDWITLRTSTPDANLPPEGTRLTPADAAKLPKLILPADTGPVIAFAPGAHHYRLLGLELSPAPGVYIHSLIDIGASAATAADVPHHIVIDRSYLHGDATAGTRRAIALGGAHIGIVDSYLADFKEVGADSQAIGGWNGPGPYKIVNNHLEGSGENVMFGGANPAIQDLVPSDIEVRNNHFFKPLSWKEGDPSYAGTAWCVKNLFELKNAQRVLVEGNILENNWADCQSGLAIVFTPRTQSGASMWCRVTDITWRYNILLGSDGGFNISGHDDQLDNPVSTRILIEHNLAYDISDVNKLYQFLNGTEHLTIRHNTSINDGTTTSAGGDPTLYLTFQDNICGYGAYGVCGTGAGCGNGTINTYFPGSTFSYNVLIGTPGGPNGNPASYPPNHWFPAGTAPVGFVDVAGNNYALLPSSPYFGAGSDGTNIGADIDSLNSYTANVLSGVWTSCADISTHLREGEGVAQFSLLPNPAADHITVRMTNAMTGVRITLVDAAGRAVLQQPLVGTSTEVSISGLSKGVFLVQLTHGDGLLLGVVRLVVVR